MKKYQFLYPAIFVKEEDGFQVFFPDLGIYTHGKNMSEAYLYAKEILRVYFSYALKYETEYSDPTRLEVFAEKCKPNETAMYIDAIVEG
ncbi:MAG: HicB family protein [Clostridia bacterium]|nr:HicB family protein [Clostridia bacterium]